MPSDELEDATNNYGSDNFEFFGSDLWLGFNVNDPTFADSRFRQAIVQAIDSTKVVADALPGRWPLRAIVPRDVPGYTGEACAALCEYSPEVARAWLNLVFPVGGIPTVILFKGGQAVKKFVGVTPKKDFAAALDELTA